MRKVCLWLIFIAAAAVAPAGATILNGGAGLRSPGNVITFDELGNLQNQTITTEFAAYGANFNNFGWDNGTYGQPAAPGFSGGDLVNGIYGFPLGDMTIAFTSLVTDAAFAVVGQDSVHRFSSYLGGAGGTLVETFDVTVPFANTSPIGFVGFTDSLFDTIVIRSPASTALSIDTLQMNVIPEPTTCLLLGLGLGACVLLRRRRA